MAEFFVDGKCLNITMQEEDFNYPYPHTQYYDITSNVNTLYFQGYTYDEIIQHITTYPYSDFLMIYFDENNEFSSLTLTCAIKKIRYIKTDVKNEFGDVIGTEIVDIKANSLIDNESPIGMPWAWGQYNVKGTNYNDIINMAPFFDDDWVYPTYNNTKGFNIKAFNGNDTITGSINSDTITGGKGKTVVNYTPGNGNDTIILTKGEQFTLNLQELENGVNDIFIDPIGKNLEISFAGREGKIILKNFITKDGTYNGTKTTENTGYVRVIFDGDEETAIDLNSLTLNYDVYTTSFKGTRFKDIIDASDAPVNAATGKGVTITGGAGNDEITGSAGKDTIKGGNGNDEIRGGEGNDLLYGNAGENKFYFQAGDGFDTVYANKLADDTLIFEDTEFENLVFTKVKNDLIISGYGGEGDKVKVLNYYKNTASAHNITIGDNTKSIADAISAYEASLNNEDEPGGGDNPGGDNPGGGDYPPGYENDGKHIIGTNGNDNLTGTDKNDIIHGKLGSDKIKGLGGDDILQAFIDANIDGGDGNDYIEVEYGFSKLKGGDGNDEIRAGGIHNEVDAGKGNDEIYVGAASVVYAGEGEDYIYTSGTLPETTKIYGGKDNDYFDLYGHYGLIYGGENDEDTPSGNDTFYVSGYKNIVYAEDGDDIINVSSNFSGGTVGYTRGDHIIYAGDGNDVITLERDCIGSTVYGGEGSDNITISYETKENFIDGGDGNDFYKVDMRYDYDSNNTIHDSEGTDTITIQTNSNENVLKTYVNINVDRSHDNDLILFRKRDEHVQQLTIQDYMGDGKIEYVKTDKYHDYYTDKDMYYKIKQDVDWDSIIENVAGWLSDNEFDSVQAALNNGTETQQNILLAYFDNIWTQAEVV